MIFLVKNQKNAVMGTIDAAITLPIITAKTTLGELLAALSLGKKPKTPTPKILLETSESIADMNGCTLFRNGFAIYKNDSGRTVRHVLYCCSASRPATESATTEDETEVKTETLSLKATALPDGLVKSKTCENTDEMTYNNWYKSVYIPVTTTSAKSAKNTSAS